MQADEDRAAAVPGDDPAVRFARRVESFLPRVHVLPGGHEQRQRVEPGEGLGAVRVVAQRRGWSAEQWERFTVGSITAALLA